GRSAPGVLALASTGSSALDALIRRKVSCVGIDLKAGQPAHIARRPGQSFFHDACCLVLRREMWPSLDELLPGNFLHVGAIVNGGLAAGWPDIELGNAIGDGDDQR